MKVFYSASGFSGAVDYVNPKTGKGMYSGKSLLQLREVHPDIVIVSDPECRALIEAKYTKPPVEITEEQWFEYLECMPPSKWQHYRGAEMFHLCEYLTQSIVIWCVRVGDRYYRMDATDKLTPAEIVAKVADHTAVKKYRVEVEARPLGSLGEFGILTASLTASSTDSVRDKALAHVRSAGYEPRNVIVVEEVAP